MLQLSASLINRPVVSLRTGAPVGQTLRPIINPGNLKIEAFYCQDRFGKEAKILLSQDIRDVIRQGLVVNDHEALSNPDELVRLQDLLKLGFELVGKPVVTVAKERVGKVVDFAADNQTFYIQKLYASRPLLKSLTGGQLSIDRSQIVEISNRRVIIQELLQKTKQSIPLGAPVVG